MRKLYLLSTLVLTIFTVTISFAQDFSNKGKDFWVGYGYHQQMLNGGNGGSQSMVLYFATDQATNITINIPGVGYTQTLTSPAGNNVLTSATIPKFGAQDARLLTEGLSNKGIHITSDKAMVTYAHVYNSSVSGATILFPTNTLGKEYYSINFKNISNTNNANAFFYVVAADTGTTQVEITPSANTTGGWIAGNTYTVTMTQGQVYNVMGVLTNNANPFTAVDLTGSKIQSIASASGACKKIAVFSGSGRISITCNNSSSSSDNYMIQSFPRTAWGKKYLTVPASGNQSYNFYRVCVESAGTVVKINGIVTALPLQGNFYYDIPQTNQPQLIEADRPIIVAQYFTSQGACGNGNPGDPEVIYLSPVEQNINKVLWNATPNFLITSHYFNVVVPNTGTAVSSFRLDGAVPVAPFIPHPQDPGYVYLQQSISSGAHIIQSDSGFNSIAYGFGSAESYGYNAGTNVKDLYQQIGVSTEFGIESTPSVCKGSPFRFKVSLPYCADSISWDLSNLPGPPPSPPTQIYTSCTPGVPGGPDSSTVVNGRTIYWYSLPTVYTFNTSGAFPVTITTNAPNTDGCGSIQEIEFDLNVFDPPVADFTFINSGCVAEPVQFTDNTTTPRPSYIWNWNFGDPGSGASNTSGLQNPSHIFSAPGTYNVTFSTITTPGCISGQVIKQVIVKPLPSANITGNVIVCVNDPSPDITFTATDGTPTYTFTYNINGGASQTIVTTGTNTSVTLPAPTGVTGTFRYNLLEVKNTGSTLCVKTYTNTFVDVVVSANTGLTLTTGSDNQAVCENNAIANIIYTISGGGNNATASGLPPGVTGVYNAGVFTISGTPTTPGTYNYTVTATGSCLPNSLTGTITVNPGAGIVLTSGTGTNNQELCVNSSITNIIYTISGGGSGGTVSGLPAGVTYVFSGGVLTISGTPTVSGTFNYTIATTGTCGQQTAIGTILVNPLPTPDFSVTAPGCETKVLTFTDLSTPNAGALNGWAWNFGDATTSTLQNPTHTYAAAGTYTVTLSVTNDKGCVSNPILTRSVTINSQPDPGFILPEVCLSDTYAQFTDTSVVASGSIVAWLWNFGDPGSGPLNTSTLQNPQHSYTSTGNYTVTLTVTTNSGCMATKSSSFTVNGDIPVSNFNALNPATMCANDSIAIQDASTVNFGSVTKVEIYWDNVNFPAVFQLDDFPTSGKIYRHLYPNFQSPLTKTFTIRYRAYSGATCVNDRIKTIVVNAAPKVQFTNMPDACLDAVPFQITQASEIGAVPGSGVFSGPGVNVTGIFNPALVGPGTYIIKYTYTSAAGGCIDSLSKPITVLDSASAQFTYSAQACESTAVTFNSTSSTIPAASGTITGWSWDFGDPASGAANTSTSQNPSHLFTGWGTYNVKLNVITSNGCRSTVRSKPVFVNPIPRPNFATPVSACLPSANITFTNTSTIPDGTQGSFGYLWNFGDPASGILNSSTGSSPSHIYNTAGPFNVNLQVTSGAGCVHDTTIVLNTIHPEPTGSFTVNKNDLCIGESFIFTDNSNPADGTTSQWNWNMGDGNVRISSSFTYIYGRPGAYTVTLFITNSYGCRSSTATRTVTVNAYPTVNAGPDLFILEGGSDTLEPIITAINPSYLWTPNTYFLGSNTIKNPVVQGVNDITYTLTVTGNGGCVASDQVFIKVLKGPEIPNIFSPNGDGIHDKWEIKYLDTYPGGTVEIFNRYGQLIFRSVGYGTPWDGTVNGNPVPLGTYYYIVNPKNGRKIMSGYVDVIR